MLSLFYVEIHLSPDIKSHNLFVRKNNYKSMNIFIIMQQNEPMAKLHQKDTMTLFIIKYFY